eukprot:maker-scaffold_37-snap-gene-2.8-mRNA-1 protein AED:0.28 eAED:0.28 QI:105/1/1/1/1/1/2/135/238
MEGLEFAFKVWLDTQTLTNHSKDSFIYTLNSNKDIIVHQQKFVHTKEEDKTGAVVWDDCVMLAKYLEFLREKDQQKFINKKVLELGAGTGLLGIVAGCLYDNESTIFITDKADMCTLIEENISCNKNAYNAQVFNKVLDWKQPSEFEIEKVDYILASGCIYHEEVIEDFISVIRNISHENTKIYLAIDHRFEITEDSEYLSPVIRTFLEKSTELKLKKISYPKKLEKFHKKSVQLYSN